MRLSPDVRELVVNANCIIAGHLPTRFGSHDWYENPEVAEVVLESWLAAPGSSQVAEGFWKADQHDPTTT